RGRLRAPGRVPAPRRADRLCQHLFPFRGFGGAEQGRESAARTPAATAGHQDVKKAPAPGNN
ncbi:hypothetical protein ACEN8K_36835, partial [Variovorax sp. CT11-76]